MHYENVSCYWHYCFWDHYDHWGALYYYIFLSFILWCLSCLCPFSTVANVENNEIWIWNNNIWGNILLQFFPNHLTLVSHYSAFLSVCGADSNVSNSLKHSRLPRKKRRMQNDVTWGWGEWRIMQGECDSKHHYSIFVSYYSLQSQQ